MAVSVGQIFSQMQRWTSAATTADISDAVLLERYIQRHEEVAFAALVARHGAMVLRLCGRILGDAHAAEDAFQAVFLILARKAHSLKQPESLSAWLYGVARRVALKARKKSTGRFSSPTALDEALPDPRPDPLTQVSARELLNILDEEVQRLPAAQQPPFVLCCLEGRTQEEAARILGCTLGSVKGRLERGRRRLQARLTRRGIALPAALAFAGISRAGSVPLPLLRSTVRAIVDGSIGNSAALLAHGVLKTMFLSKCAAALSIVLTITLVASGAIALAYRAPAPEVPEDKTSVAPAVPKHAGASKPPARTDALGDPLPDGAIARLGSLRLYHGEHVQRVTLSPDGKWVVSTAIGGNRLWDAASGRERPLRDELRAAAILATRDKLVAVAKHNLDLQLWDVVADKKIGALLPAAKVGQLFAEIHLGWPDGYSPFALAPDGRTLVIAMGSFLRFCDPIAGKVEEPIDLKLGNVSRTRMTFSADGKSLVLQYDNATVLVWDAVRRTEILRARPNANDYGGRIALSADGKILATASFTDKGVRLWDPRTLKELPPLLKQPKEFVGAMAFAPDGKQLAVSYSVGPTVRLWDVASRQETRQFQGKAYQIFHLIFSTDGKYLVAGDGDGVTFWDAATGKFRHDFGHTYTIDSVAFSPDGKRLVSGAAYTDKIIHIWDPLTGKETAQLLGHTSGIEVVAYAPDGQLIASGSQDGSIRLWDAATGREIRRLEANDGRICAMAFSPDGKTIASGGKRKAVHLWDVATGREVRSFDNPGKFILRLAFSPDGKMLATRGMDEREIRLWNVAEGKQIHRLIGPKAACPSLIFSPDGQTLVAGSNEASVRLWDTCSGEERGRITVPLEPGDENRVYSVAFSPDGRSLAVGYADRTVRLWELASRRERLRFEGHRLMYGHLGGIMSLAFSADGTLLASGGLDHIIMVWDVTGQRTTNLPRKDRLHREEGNALWRELADADTAKAYRAMQTLLAAEGQAVSLLKECLRPAAASDARRIDRLIADLDSDQFAVREKAGQELRQMGADVDVPLRKVLAGKPTAEQRLRVKQLLQEIESAPSPEYLRGLRAVEVLEHIGTAGAQEVLKKLADGGRHARLTREAKASLERLANKRR